MTKVGDIVLISKDLGGVPKRCYLTIGKITSIDLKDKYPFVVQFKNHAKLRFRENEFTVISNNKLVMELYK